MGKHPGRELNPYFALNHGHIVSVNSIREKAPQTVHAVNALIEANKVVGQHVLSLDGYTRDMVIWMPEKMVEREAKAQERVNEIRRELRSLGKETIFDGECTLEPRKPIDIRKQR